MSAPTTARGEARARNLLEKKMSLTRIGLTLALATVIGALLPPATAQAAYQGRYNRTASAVAKEIRCLHPRLHDAGGMTKTSLVCDLRSMRVNVITFSGERQQTRWLATVDYAFPDGGYVGVGRGVVIVARNGNRAAASAGAAAVNGAVMPVGL